MTSINVLVVFKSPDLNEAAEAGQWFSSHQVSTHHASDWRNALAENHWDLILLDLSENDGFKSADKEALLGCDRSQDCELLVFSNGKASPILDETVREFGGFHFRRPWQFDNIAGFIEDIFQDLAKVQESSEIPKSSDLDQFGFLLGSSAVMQNLYRTLRKVSRIDASVLIAGESGTGKELVAKTIHHASDRSEEPFVAINCGALSPELVESELFGHKKGAFTGAARDHEGVFSQAEGGTLFLDEVTEMPLDQQVKLLRVLETGYFRALGASAEKKSNVRIVAATNRVLEQAISEGIFREDLYYRLAQFPVNVPPLRDRGGDSVGLAEHFLLYLNNTSSSAKGISAAAFDKISQYSWPGNVRELKYAIERAFVLATEVIEPDNIQFDNIDSDIVDSDSLPSGVPLDAIEQAVIEKTLDLNDGNKSKSADQLGISVKTLYNKLERYQQEE